MHESQYPIGVTNLEIGADYWWLLAVIDGLIVPLYSLFDVSSSISGLFKRLHHSCGIFSSSEVSD